MISTEDIKVLVAPSFEVFLKVAGTDQVDEGIFFKDLLESQGCVVNLDIENNKMVSYYKGENFPRLIGNVAICLSNKALLEKFPIFLDTFTGLVKENKCYTIEDACVFSNEDIAMIAQQAYEYATMIAETTTNMKAVGQHG